LEEKIMKGKVKFFNAEKEFGFIVGEDEEEYYVHKTGLEEGVTIGKDDAVTFEAEKGDKGMKAVKVKKEK
jgi:CspA family cold shock protein